MTRLPSVLTVALLAAGCGGAAPQSVDATQQARAPQAPPAPVPKLEMFEQAAAAPNTPPRPRPRRRPGTSPRRSGSSSTPRRWKSS